MCSTGHSSTSLLLQLCLLLQSQNLFSEVVNNFFTRVSILSVPTPVSGVLQDEFPTFDLRVDGVGRVSLQNESST